MASGGVRDRYLDAALELLGTGEPLTLQRLGTRMGLTHTAVYRHFKDLSQLLTELVDRQLGALLAADDSGDLPPRDAILTLAQRLRTGLTKEPALVAALLGSEYVLGSLEVMSREVVRQLRRMGLEGSALTTCYQALESVVLGATAFDLAGAPQHLAIRSDRIRRFADPAFDEISRDEADVARNTEEAFLLAVTAVLDVCEVRARAE
jgi:AcrR family transcriptional regulator